MFRPSGCVCVRVLEKCAGFPCDVFSPPLRRDVEEIIRLHAEEDAEAAAAAAGVRK
jgi:hypothetical protein